MEPAERSVDSPILTRFVVDVVSGTSAGGINGIFLAKALAGELGIEQLSNLWVDEADLQRLVNDERSLEGIPGLAAEDPASSLLNSGRMYWKLLDALDEMDRNRSGESSTPSREQPVARLRRARYLVLSSGVSADASGRHSY